MENISIPVGYIAIPVREYEYLKEDSFVLGLLLPALLDRIFVRDHYDPKETEPWIAFDDSGILDLLKAVVPAEYGEELEAKITLWRNAKPVECEAV